MSDLESRLARLEASTYLGFGEPPSRRTIHCNTSKGGLWYFWNGSTRTHESIDARSITGFVAGLRCEKGEYEGQPTYHLLLDLDCGRQRYTLSAQTQSVFAKCIFVTLAEIPCYHLATMPLCIEPQAGAEKEKALLANVYLGNELQLVKWPSKDDPNRKARFLQLMKLAIANVSEALMLGGENPGARSPTPQTPHSTVAQPTAQSGAKKDWGKTWVPPKLTPEKEAMAQAIQSPSPLAQHDSRVAEQLAAVEAPALQDVAEEEPPPEDQDYNPAYAGSAWCPLPEEEPAQTVSSAWADDF